ncbi:unnamed protein product [Phaeothamnion confervicola]
MRFATAAKCTRLACQSPTLWIARWRAFGGEKAEVSSSDARSAVLLAEAAMARRIALALQKLQDKPDGVALSVYISQLRGLRGAAGAGFIDAVLRQAVDGRLEASLALVLAFHLLSQDAIAAAAAGSGSTHAADASGRAPGDTGGVAAARVCQWRKLMLLRLVGADDATAPALELGGVVVSYWSIGLHNAHGYRPRDVKITLRADICTLARALLGPFGGGEGSGGGGGCIVDVGTGAAPPSMAAAVRHTTWLRQATDVFSAIERAGCMAPIIGVRDPVIGTVATPSN